MRVLGFARGLALVAAVAVAGCETHERVVPGSSTKVRYGWEEDDEPRETREDVLRRRTEEEPESPKAWFDLGSFYEDAQQFGSAITCYEQFYALLKQEQARSGVYFTAGAYHLGRAHARARNYPQAVHYLREVLSVQPKDPIAASLNSHFREAHYLLGAVYYENRQWKPARDHFISFRELGGEPVRVEPWLARIDEAEWSSRNRARRSDGTKDKKAGEKPASPPSPAPAAPPQAP